MNLSWTLDLDRTELIRQAAKILAYQRDLVASRPHEWRIHILARELLAELHAQKYPVHADIVLFRDRLTRYDLDSRQVTTVEGRTWFGHVHVSMDTGAPCIHLMDGESRKCTDENLLLEGGFWLRPEAHDRLAQFLRLDGAACSPNLLGPWQDHDVKQAATLRAAAAAWICWRAYDEEKFHYDTALTASRFWQLGKTVEDTFIAPWQSLFERYLKQVAEIGVEGGERKTWKFDRGETQWTLKLCWAIIKAAHRIRLDCPPQVIPLQLLQTRGPLSIQAAILRYLVDDLSGPRVRAAAAAHMLGLSPSSVHEMLSNTREKHPRPEFEEPELWDPFEVKDAILMPMAMTTSRRTREEERRDDAKAPGNHT